MSDAAVQRAGLELLLDWIDALRQADLDAIHELLVPDVVWYGLSADLVCTGRPAVLDVLREQVPVRCDGDALELLRGPAHLVLGMRSDTLPHPAGIDVDQVAPEMPRHFALSCTTFSAATRPALPPTLAAPRTPATSAPESCTKGRSSIVSRPASATVRLAPCSAATQSVRMPASTRARSPGPDLRIVSSRTALAPAVSAASPIQSRESGPIASA